ncbi:VWA domain-containing protein [Edaphobacter paludis]|uniref:VWA domain-containing protein n=1 Tax=Edaphobacter paludis TaxID=3035702 RepID=A0AAU7D9B1_9BACT
MPDEVVKAMPMKLCVPLRKVFVLCCVGLSSCGYAAAQQEAKPPSSPYNIEVTVKKLLVPVVVRDKQGHSVGDLKREDFQVFDNGKPHPLSAFMVEERVGAESRPASNSENGTLSPTPSQSSTVYPRFIVFLFDDLHLSAEDIVRAKRAGATLLSGSLVDSDIAAVVSLSGQINSGLTRDRAKLQDAITSLKPQILYRSSNSDCPNIDYYQADLMENKHNDVAIQDAIAQVFSCDPGLDPQRDLPIAERLAESAARRILSIGHQDVQTSFATIREIVRRMATLPGQSTLILVSPGFLTVEPDALAAESRVIDFAAQSNVTISALDARGLYTTSLTASEDVQGIPLVSKAEFHASSMRAVENVMAELADGTGGTFFHNNNDLGAGFRSLTETPEYVYLLELPLDNIKPNGAYHRLKVKVDRNGVQVQARSGYILPKPAKTKK